LLLLNGSYIILWKFKKEKRLMPGITRPDTIAQAFNPANGIHARAGRVHAVVRRGQFLSSSEPLLLRRARPYISPSLKISSDFTRPITSRTRSRRAAPFAVAFVPGQHCHTYINPGPAARITFTIASALGTRF
jgi:hypothetical protein